MPLLSFGFSFASFRLNCAFYSFYNRNPFQSYLFIKGLFLVILCGTFFISSWFNATVTAYWKYLLCSLLMEFVVAFLFFIQLRESLYDPPKFGFLEVPNLARMFLTKFYWMLQSARVTDFTFSVLLREKQQGAKVHTHTHTHTHTHIHAQINTVLT